MKKILLIAALFISTGIASSCTKDNVAPKISKSALSDETVQINDSNVGMGDGGVDRPKRP